MMPTIPITQITIDREIRQRRELTHIDELAASIANIGMINPIVVTDQHVLIAGERRLSAAKTLGWDSVPVTIFEDLSPAQQQLIELEENVKREDLPWKDHCAAIARYHALRRETDTEWTQANSADALGLSRQHMQSRLTVQMAIESEDELVCKAERYSIARGIVQRKQQRASVAANDAVEKLANIVAPGAGLPLPSSSALLEGDGDISGIVAASLGFVLQNTSFLDWLDVPTETGFNFIHCDFPYGINAGQHASGNAKNFGGYADSKEIYTDLIAGVARAIKSGVIADNAHLMFWFSMDYYEETRLALGEMGWKVNPFPLIWYKSDNSGILPDPKRGPRRIYETAFMASLGDRQVVRAVANVVAAGNTKKIHMSEKNPEMLANFFRMFVDETTKMLDPTMGSANAVRAAYEAGANFTMGLEISEEFYNNALTAHGDLLEG